MTTQEEIQKFILIEGTFSPEDAREILFELISSKIKFHHREAFGIQTRTNGDISHSEKRVEELKASRQKMDDIIDFAARHQLKMKLSGEIKITLSE